MTKDEKENLHKKIFGNQAPSGLTHLEYDL